MRAALSSHEAVAALESNLWSLWSNFGRGDGCALVEESGILRFETPLPHVPYNTVLRFHGDGEADTVIDATLGTYHARGVPMIWLVHPSATPLDLAVRLEHRGLVQAEIISGMVGRLDVLPVDDPAPDGVVVEEVGPDTHDSYLELLAWRYTLPPDAIDTLRSILGTAGYGRPGAATRGWVAHRDGVVVSKVTLHVHEGTAGIYGVATRPEARGLGLARLLTIRALAAARATGAEVGVLHSTLMAVSLYAALGFQYVADFKLYAEPDTLHL